MKKLLIALCLILAAAQGAAQEKRAWEVVYGNPSTAIGPMTMHFASPDTGFVGGAVIFDITVDGGKTWRPANYKFETIPMDGPTWCIYKIEFWGSKIGYARGYDGGKSLLLKTTDGGATWENIYPKEQGLLLSDRMSIISPDTAFFIAQGDSILYNYMVYRTADGGKTFEPLNPPPMLSPQDNPQDYTVGRVRFFNSQEGVIVGTYKLATDANGRRDWIRIHWVTKNGGETWEIKHTMKIKDRVGPYFRTWQCFSLEDWVFQGSYLSPITGHFDSPYLYSTRNGGKTWQTSRLEEDTTLLSAMDVMFFHNPDTGYVCTYNYESKQQFVYATFDGGKSWVKEPINFTGAGSGGIETMHFPTACTGYMGGIPYHIFKTTTCGKPVSKEPLAAKAEPSFALYPSPAQGGKANLAFTLPASARLSLTLVDPLGRRRPLLPLTPFPPGKNEYTVALPQKGLWLLLVEPENQPPQTLKIWAE
jgi:photosystem II stability/assembly factor-like uncharacterized protein